MLNLSIEEMDQRVTALYNDWWKVYRNYTKTHDMAQFNRDICMIKERYRDMEPFTTDWTFPFATEIIVPMHAEYLMEIKNEK